MAFEEKSLSHGLFDDRSIDGLINLLDKDVQQAVTFVENAMPTEQEVYRFLNILPEGKREYAGRKFGKFLKDGEDVRNVGKAYIQIEAAMNTVAEYMKNAYRKGAVEQFARSNPAYQNVVKKPEDFANVYKDLFKKASSYRKVLSKAFKDFITDGVAVDNLIKQYSKHTATHAENLVAIGMSVGFAGLVLYALSQINPENVTVGAFFAGSNSSVLLTMLSAVVIFLLFFLTHHKLK